MNELVEKNKSKIEKEYGFDRTAPAENKMSDRGDSFDIDYDENGDEVIIDHGNPKIDIVIKGDDDDYIGVKDKDVGGRRTRRKTRRTKRTKRRKTRGGKRSKKTRRR
jgi:hypothetical protein